MDNDKKKQPRYVAENRTVCQTGTVPDDAICWCDNHDDAEHIANCLNACDGAEGLTPGCVERQREYTREEIHAAGHRIRQAAIALKDKDAEIARLKAAQADMAMLIRRIAKGRSTDAQCAAMDYLARTGQAGTLLRNNNESEATDDQQ